MITGGINSVFSFWIPDNLDRGHLEYVYWAVSVMVLLNFVAFVQCAQTFEYTQMKIVNPQRQPPLRHREPMRQACLQILPAIRFARAAAERSAVPQCYRLPRKIG